MKSLYENNMQISRVKKHDYLRININFSIKLQVAVTMVDYLKGVISNFKAVEILTGTTASPDSKHLYIIREECYQNKLDN